MLPPYLAMVQNSCRGPFTFGTQLQNVIRAKSRNATDSIEAGNGGFGPEDFVRGSARGSFPTKR
jgi:hypothetical protein